MTPTAIPFKKLILIAGDVAVFAAAIMASPFIRNLGAPEAGIIELYRLAAPFLAALWLVGFVMFGLYDLKAAKNGPPFFEALARALLFNFAVTVFLFYLIPEFRLRPLVTLLIIFAVLGLAIAAWRAGYNAVLARMAKERVLFLGAGEDVRELAEFLVEHPQLGFAPVAFVANGNGETGQTEKLNLPAPVISAEGKLADLVRTHAASMIVVAHDIKRNRAFLKNIFPVVPLGVTITDFSHFYELVRGKIPVSLIGEAWFLENLIGAKRPKYELAKRILDLLTATALGAIALLLLAPIAVAIALSTPGDILRYRKLRAHTGDGMIFFRQKRIGKNGVPFGFIKFRSQVLGAERLGREKGEGPDPRAYPAGTFLRKTYLDELAQVWNVIKGEMSLVGPRPERPEFVRELERTIPFYRMRELVLPGITGWAQINMENDASVSDAPEKLCYDLYYIKNRSLALDLAILAKTVLKLLQRSGR